jgi:hypothetical protein
MLVRYRPAGSARRGRSQRRRLIANQAKPASVMTTATKKLSRRPKKCAEESIGIVSSKIRYPE